MTRDEVLAAVQQNYPAIFAIINQPGIFDVMDQAFSDPMLPWTSAQITEALQQTPYFQQTSQSARNWDVLLAVDPATARQRGDLMTQQVLSTADRLGYTLDPARQWEIVTTALREGFDQSQLEHLILTSGAALSGHGQAAGYMQQVKDMASQYGVPMSDQGANMLAQQMNLGVQDQNSMKAYMVEQAKSLYPALGSALDAGITVRQYADPYAQIAAQELGINPNEFNLSDSKWAAPLQQIDPQTGQRTAMTLAAWQSKVRSDPTYGYDQSNNGRDQAAQFATSLAKEFGAFG